MSTEMQELSPIEESSQCCESHDAVNVCDEGECAPLNDAGNHLPKQPSTGEKCESWRRLLQPPDYILMQSDLPSTSSGMTRGRKGGVTYSHPKLHMSCDESFGGNSFDWIYRPPLDSFTSNASTTSNLSDDVFCVSAFGGSVKQVKADDIYEESDNSISKKSKTSKSKSHHQHIRRERHKVKSKSDSVSDLKADKRKTASISSTKGHIKDEDTIHTSAGDQSNLSEHEMPESIGTLTSLTHVDSTPTDTNQNKPDSVCISRKLKESIRKKYALRKDEIVLVDTMGSQDLSRLQDDKQVPAEIHWLNFLAYSSVTLCCCPVLGLISIICGVISHKSREKGDVRKSKLLSSVANWSAIFGMAFGMLCVVSIMSYLLVVPWLRSLLTSP